MIVTLSLSLPSLFPGIQGVAIGSAQDLYLLQVCFLAHLVQLLLTYEAPESEMEVENEEEVKESPSENRCEGSSTSNSDAEWMLSMLDCCRRWANLPPITVEAQHLLDYIKESC